MFKNVKRRVLRGVGLIVVITASCLSSGCSHNLTVSNLGDYHVIPSVVARQSIKIGVTSNDMSDPEKSKYIAAIVESLQRNSNVERVIYPFSQANHGDMVDAAIDITVNPRYDGVGTNFFVNWPGFVIFAPAIWGYGYVAELDTSATITIGKSSKLQQIKVPTKYEFRHADIDRTWTEVGWFEMGIIPLIGGVVFTSYDTDATSEFIRMVSSNYGTYVSSKIVKSSYDLLGYK